MKAQEILKNNLNNSITAKKKLLADEDNLNEFNLALNCLLECYKNGGKLYLAGNGGSAADSQHLAAELISKLAYDRNPLPAEAITTDTSAITANIKSECASGRFFDITPLPKPFPKTPPLANDSKDFVI